MNKEREAEQEEVVIVNDVDTSRGTEDSTDSDFVGGRPNDRR